MEKVKTQDTGSHTPKYDVEDSVGLGQVTDVLNASGHKQELERNFNLLSICSIGITTGNVWAALGGSIVSFHLMLFSDSPISALCLKTCADGIVQVIALYNGGAPGVIYEFIVVCLFYFMIAACIAEMASAIPSSAGVYHWASVTGGRYGRCIGYFSGWYASKRPTS